jgi:N-acyl-L-homoserine lactone synthetase
MASREHALTDRNAGPQASPSGAGDPQAVSCEIRAIATLGELIESYRLRHEAYRALGYLQRYNSAELDIDEYDLLSIPFGAFDVASGALVGTLRLITTERQPDYARMIEHILAEVCDDELTAQALGPRLHPLPAIVSDEIARQIAAFNTDGFVVHELSRFIVRPGHRGSGGSGISRRCTAAAKLGLGLLGIAQAMRYAPAVIIAGCLPEHNQMYARFGFLKLPHTGLSYFDSVGQTANTIISRTDLLPQPTLSHIDELLCAMASGAPEHTLELGRDVRALYQLGGAPRRFKRETMEW